MVFNDAFSFGNLVPSQLHLIWFPSVAVQGRVQNTLRTD